MMRRGKGTGGLGTRIALRTFVLFCVCAIVPTALFAFIGYRVVNTELIRHAREHLEEASKSYAVLINERLIQTDTLLTEYARVQLQSAIAPDARALDPARIKIISLDKAEEPGTTALSPPVSRLETISDENGVTVRLDVTVSGFGQRVRIVGEPVAEYLWDTSAVEMPATTLCVYAGAHMLLHCSSTDEEAIELSDPVSLTAKWPLFLKPRFGAGEWTVRVQQRDSTAFAAMRSLSKILPIAAGLAMIGAMLLSSVQIRRSHRPLALLMRAADAMRRGRLNARVPLSGKDEYAGLGRAFNRMAGTLKRQIQLLRMLSRIDRLILMHPAIGPVADSVLPRVLKTLNCDSAALLLWEEQEGFARVYSVNREAPFDVECRRVMLASAVMRAFSEDRAEGTLSQSDLEAWHVLPRVAGDALAWCSSTIKVEQRSRGALLLGFAAQRRNRRRSAHHASELAHRFAVALGNEDRDRALLRQAYYDSLTGLPNRQLFKDRLEQELSRSGRSGATVALFFIDLDRFKNINDSLGHSAGDEVLSIAAQRLRAVVRDVDTLARLGGDEFTVICPGMNGNGAAALAQRIHEAFSVATPMESMQCVVQASIGIAIFPRDGENAETLVRNADTAMYRAKSTGRGKAIFFEEAMNEQAVRRLRLEQRLREALERNALTLYFQPKVYANHGRLAGVEALARWQDPAEGMISPAEFIPIAEESGLIVKLGAWAFRAACESLQGWRRQGLEIEHVAVNVSMHQLRDPAFADFIDETLRELDLPAHCIEIELTESTLAEDPHEVAERLKRIRDLGVRIAIDDFGTGYSSMAVLAQMPVDILKIDRAFVRNCATSSESGALLGALVGVAQALGKQVVAEGVETPMQAAFLRAHGCQFMQGFLFGKPMPAAELERSIFVEPVQRTA